MIRPFTLLCFLLAAGSGLYLYQVKHRAELLDRQIRRIQEATAAAREHAGLLRAEYQLLNDPQRLAELASQHLPALQPTLPKQWSTMAELEHRLPPVASTTAPPEPEAAPVAAAAVPPPPAAAQTAPVAPTVPVALAAPRPAPPRPAARPLAVVATRPTPAAAVAAGPAALPVPHLAAGSLARPSGPARQQQVPVFPVLAAGHTAPRDGIAAASDGAAPAGTAEAAARPARGGPGDASVSMGTPVVASALGMARTMLQAGTITPANAATLYTVGTAR